MPNPRDLMGLALLPPRSLRAAADLLDRLPDIERSITTAVSRAQWTLDQLLERVRPIEADLDALRDAAGTLEGQLAATERQIAATDAKVAELEDLIAQLIVVAIRVEGAAEHFLDKVPGLSAERAEARAAEIARETRADPTSPPD
jgi:chromosome segregation ATPase